MQNDMIKLNTLLNKEKGTHDNLHQDNILLENDFIMALKVSSQSLLKLWYTMDSYVVHSIALLKQFFWMFDNFLGGRNGIYRITSKFGWNQGGERETSEQFSGGWVRAINFILSIAFKF